MVLFVLVRAENGKWENGKWEMGIWGSGKMGRLEIGKWELEFIKKARKCIPGL